MNSNDDYTRLVTENNQLLLTPERLLVILNREKFPDVYLSNEPEVARIRDEFRAPGRISSRYVPPHLDQHGRPHWLLESTGVHHLHISGYKQGRKLLLVHICGQGVLFIDVIDHPKNEEWVPAMLYSADVVLDFHNECDILCANSYYPIEIQGVSKLAHNLSAQDIWMLLQAKLTTLTYTPKGRIVSFGRRTGGGLEWMALGEANKLSRDRRNQRTE